MDSGDNVTLLYDGPGLLSMPSEILEHIWLAPQLDHCDVCRLAVTCSKFENLSNSNEVWKQKLNNRWPDLLSRYHQNEHCAWKDEFKKRLEVSRAIAAKIANMSRLYIHKEEVQSTGFECLGCIEDDKTARITIDALMELYHGSDSHKNLTCKYYAKKALCHVHQVHTRSEWRSLLTQPADKSILEKGAVLIAQWCQPTETITDTSVAVSLDSIARQVIAEVVRRHPDHPMTKKNPEDLIAADLMPSLWTPDQSYKILKCLNHVFFEELKFSGNEEDYYNPLNSYINMVLTRRKGIPISLCLIYASVARRLHVLCEPVNFPSHFLLRWLQYPKHEEGQEYTYIDVFHKGQFMNEYECSSLLDVHLPDDVIYLSCQAITPMKVFERMARNLVNIGRQQGQLGDGVRCLRNAVELLLSICPNEMDACILQARLYLHLGINLKEVIESLQSLTTIGLQQNAPTGLIGYLVLTAMESLADQSNEPEVREITAKNRSEAPEVELSIGLIMTHKRYNYTCVIYGWDAECGATQEWMLQMGVNNLDKQNHQPFYNVLVDDGSNRYAAQENLELATEPKVIPHPEVGRYFQEFCGTHYLPNNEMLHQYPEDMTTTLRYIAEKYT